MNSRGDMFGSISRKWHEQNSLNVPNNLQPDGYEGETTRSNASIGVAFNVYLLRGVEVENGRRNAEARRTRRGAEPG